MRKRLFALLCILGLTISLASAAEAGASPEPAGTAETAESAEPVTSPTPEETAPAGSGGPTVYTDVPDTEWYAGEVAEVTERGIMTGVEEGRFAPLEPVTRATAITVLWRLAGCPQADSQDLFPDVTAEDPHTAWYFPQAVWAKAAGIAMGYEDGAFHGDDLISREALAVFLFRYAQYADQPIGEGILTLFNDAGLVSDWAQEAMCHVVGLGLYRGNDLGDLDPQSTATRAELAAILRRLLAEAVG